MPLVSAGTLVAQAKSAGRAIAAFNVVTLEQAQGIAAAAARAQCGVILQISENAVRFHGGAVHPLAAACRAVAQAAPTDIGLHFDHVTDLDLVAQAADAGFSSVMVDASALDHGRNIEVTAAATRRLHDQGLWVEAELGEVGGKDGAHAFGARTDPGEAAAYVQATGVDALAVAVGSSHAMTERTARLDHQLTAELAAATGLPLVLHGSSGVAPEELRAAISAGMTKINIGTLIGAAYAGALRDALADMTIRDPRKALVPARQAVEEAALECLRDLGLAPQSHIREYP